MGKLALIIDDSPTVRAILEFQLARLGLNTRSFSNGIEFFHWLTQSTSTPDVLIIDMNLPKMSGYDVLQRFKSISRYDRTAVVLKLAPMLQIAGLHDVTSRRIETPLGSWGGRQGHLMSLDMQHIFESLKDFYCQSLAIEGKVFDATLAALPREWEQFKTVYTFYVVYGKK